MTDYGSLRLVPLGRRVLRDLVADPLRALETDLRASNAAEIAAAVQQIAEPILALYERANSRAPWIAHLARRRSDGIVVGTCAFTGPPSGDERRVEIAYFTFPGHEGAGVATAMAKALVGIARNSAEVREIVAHTLAGEEGASARILRRLGFRPVGSVPDPEHGEVRRWSLSLQGGDNALG